MPTSQPSRNFHLLAAITLLVLLALLIYHSILFPASVTPGYPWGSDTLGHILRAETMQEGIQQGDWLPRLMPDWYLGIQLFRYYPPLPYILLAGLTALGHDPVAAANWFLFLCALAGGLSWLAFRRWTGWVPALLGGGLYLFLPDNIRVAFAEGNLPRALATALLPLAIYFLLRMVNSDHRPLDRVGLALCMAAIVLTHAMMAAIYAACFALLIGLLWSFRAIKTRPAAWAITTIMAGLLLSGWWLLPSLTGGITEINAAAMTEALAVIPFQNYLNPFIRANNPEVIYIGVALLVLAISALGFSPKRNRYSLALTLTGLCGVLITTPGFNQVFNALPLHNLLWPLRFLGIASTLLLLALVWRLEVWSRQAPWIAGLGIALLALDGAGSLFLIHLRPLQPDLPAISQELALLPGWREATLDQSVLGSGPAYLFTAAGKREQVFGWAYQGASNASDVAALNDAMQYGQLAYLADRLNRMGVDDVVLWKGAPNAAQTATTLQQAGFLPAYDGKITSLYHRDGSPRAFQAQDTILGIGQAVRPYAFLFPQITVGGSQYLEDYSVQELESFQTILLAGFHWRNQAAAENLVRQVAASRTRVLIDLTGVSDDPLARIPHFLDVWGERVVLAGDPLSIDGANHSYRIGGFSQDGSLWYTYTPQGLDGIALESNYLDEPLTVYGYRQVPNGQVWFLGLNLAYHAMLTQDPAAIALLSDVLQLPAQSPSDINTIPLEGYLATSSGYQFSIDLNEATRLIVPVAYQEGMQVKLDGKAIPATASEDMPSFSAPAGRHAVQIRLGQTPVYFIGYFATLIGGLLILLSLLPLKRLRLAFRGAWKVGITVLLATFLVVKPAAAAGPIALDGHFDDWAGMPCVPDPLGDIALRDLDLINLCFATNPGDESAFFMAERSSQNSRDSLDLNLYIDTDNNGNYNAPNDRLAVIHYDLKNKWSRVDVNLYDGTGAFLSTIANNADWGEGWSEGGSRVEWGIPFAALGINPQQAIRLFMVSTDGAHTFDRLPDAGDIQWSPANILSWPLLILFGTAGAGWLAYRRKRHA
jgi:uncharacterized membrane protein